jgi:hypothetical protein
MSCPTVYIYFKYVYILWKTNFATSNAQKNNMVQVSLGKSIQLRTYKAYSDNNCPFLILWFLILKL